MPEAAPAARVVDRRQRGDDTEAALQLGLKFGERDLRRGLDQSGKVGLVGFEARAAMAAVARGGGAAGRPHPLHQFDRGRRADRKAPGGGADRAAKLDRTHDPEPQIQGDRCWHDDISLVSTIIVESQAPIPRNRKML